MSKAVFGELPRSPGALAIGSGGERKYLGSERRKTNRRSGIDRRTEVRFEPGGDDRRASLGRRHDDQAPQFW